MNSPLIFHRQIKIGPFTYGDRELWGVRTRTLWIGQRIIVSWRVR